MAPRTGHPAARGIRGAALGLAIPILVGAQVARPVRPAAPRCYRLGRGAWNPPLRDSTYYRIPSFIRLDTLPWDANRWHLEPAIPYPYGRTFPKTPSWDVRGDTVRLLWSNGFAATVIRLVPRDDVLAGFASAESDARPVPPARSPQAAIVAHRTSCVHRAGS